MGKDVQLEQGDRSDAGPDRRDPGEATKAGGERLTGPGILGRFTGDPGNTLCAAFVFLFSLVIYTLTMNPTVPFWDAGEYIATSYTLGVPHAPGTPLYVLIGRVFTLVPIASVAQRVNWLSAFSSAFAILFTYLITVKVSRKILPWEAAPFNRRVALVGGVVAAMTAAFARTFWDNAIEAEVYAASCALTTLVIWLVLRWEERLDEGNEDGLLLIITYLVGLGVGIHLGVAVAAWAAVIYVFVIRPHYLKRWDYLGWAMATLSLGAGINAAAFLVAPAILVVTLVHWLVYGKLRKLALWSSALFMLGVSVHLYLIIRSNLDPMINEAAPKNWDALWKMLIRDQYKPPPIWQRKADFFGYQFPYMYLRYMGWNLHLGDWLRMSWILPVLLTAVGAAANVLREKKSAVLLWFLFMLLGPVMAFYLNFREGEVRERDYFFVQNFQLMAIWTGMGVAVVLVWLRSYFQGNPARTPILAGAGALFLVMSFLPLTANFKSHDRRGFYVAHNYAYNMLIALEPNAVIFTNGDNDTFPLWYLQEVEGVRKDVRVVNLSLLNTNWYIKQLRDLNPKVPIAWSDSEIDGLNPYRDRDGRIWMVKDMAVRHILETNAWRLPTYIAVTVPDQMGLTPQLVMEGLVFRIEQKPVSTAIDLEKTRKNLNEVYRFQGLITKDPTGDASGDEAALGDVEKPGRMTKDPTDYRSEFGVYDASVFKDDNSEKLVQNYAAAFSRVALELYRVGRLEESLAEINKAQEISPYFPAVMLAKGAILEALGRIDEAIAFYEYAMKRYPGDWQLRVSLGQLLLRQGRTEEALAHLQTAIDLAPTTEWEPYQAVTSAYYNAGYYEQAIVVMERWLVLHPEDRELRDYLGSLKQAVRSGVLKQGTAPSDSAEPDTADVPLQGSD